MTSNFEFTDKAQESLATAIQLARDHHNAQVHPAHLASALLSEGSGHAQGAQPQHQQHSIFAGAIQKAGGDTAAVQRAIQKLIVRLPAQEPAPEETSIGPAMQRLLREAQSLQKSMHDSYIAQDHLLLALLKDPNMADVFKSCALSETALKSAIEQMRGNKRVDSKSAESGFDALNKYAQDLTALAEEGKLDPVIGRDNEIRRVIRVLSRRTKNNPVLIGEPGVGKTAIAEGLAQRIVKRDVPASLICRLFSVDMGALMAGAKYKGEYEERVKSLLDKVDKSAEQGTPVILFIDEMHLLMAGRGGEGGGMDAANLFKPLLARGKLRCIGATTLAEYRKYIETDQGLERRFAPVIVNEPSVPETLSILRGLREKYELFHAVRIMDGSLVQAATLAKRYLMARRLPDAAIDLVDEACASVRVTRETAPEAIDKLERRKLELDIEIYALEREKDSASKDRLVAARKARADLDEQLRPLKAAYEAEKKRTDEIANVRRRIEEPKAKADDAAARCGGEGEAAQDGEDHQRLGRRPARGGQGRDERHPPLALGSEEFWTAHCQLPHGWIEWYRQDTHEQNCSTPIPSPALGFALDAQPVAAPPSHFRDTQNDVTEIGTQDNTVALNELDPALDVFGDEDGVADAHRHELLSVACSGGDWAEDLRGDAIATATGSPRRDDAFARCPAREGELAAGARHGGETTHAVCRHARDDALRFALNGFAPAIDGFDDEELVGDARRRELVAGASHGGAAEPDGEQHVH